MNFVVESLELVDEDDASLSLASTELGENTDSQDERALERQTLARKENQAVGLLRVAVVAVLVVTTVLVSVGVYLYTKSDQQEDFETEFQAWSAKVLESFHDSVERKLESIDAMSVTYTSFALATNSSFPNVTLPHFEVRGANTRILADSALIQYSPLVTDETRAGWEAYALAEQDYFETSLLSDMEQQARQDKRFGLDDEPEAANDEQDAPPIFPPDPFKTRIENMDQTGTAFLAPEGSGPYLPVWQITPVVPMKRVLNFNVLTHPSLKATYGTVIETSQAVLGFADNLAQEHLGATGLYFKLNLAMGQYRHDIEEFLGEPTSSLGYPVFDSFQPDRKVVGLVATSLYWNLYFRDILPHNAFGIICVLENTLGQTFSYRIDGHRATYLGAGDWHDNTYNYLEASQDISQSIATKTGPETRAYTSVDLNEEYCSYTLRVYPSQETKDEFLNNAPLIYTIVVASVFLFTSVVFVTYDWLVARRQRIVMDRAVASGAIVSSLFPSKIRDQIYEENKEQDVKAAGKSAWVNDNKGVVSKALGEGEESVNMSARPIAELFQNTTIMFADLAGFTKWSSTRTPTEVFELLETLYRAFDRIAVTRKVFKVETIGDCYVAVTGLPEPQEDHALRMAKFARDCILKMSQLTMNLVDTLGEDTANLEMRIGLHSGSVTGGVLRGQKSRFQLFGDTMNTASRMESNGVGGRIHASQETAEELIREGKEDWITPRADKIVAKGKGELQTYWVEITSAKSTGTLATTKSTSLSNDSGPPSGALCLSEDFSERLEV